MSRLRIVLVCRAPFLSRGSQAMSDESKADRPTISVTGVGKISAIPDIAEVRVGVMTQAATAQEALRPTMRR